MTSATGSRGRVAVADALFYPLAGVFVCALLWLAGRVIEYLEVRHDPC